MCLWGKIEYGKEASGTPPIFVEVLSYQQQLIVLSHRRSKKHIH
jgi:hypothetical protein